MLTSERRKSPLPHPFLPKENKQYHFVALAKAPKPRQRLSDASIGSSSRSLPASLPSAPRAPPTQPTFFATPAAARAGGPTLTEKEEAHEEQIELERFHSSAQPGRAGGATWVGS